MSLGCWRGCRVHTRHGVELHKGGKAALVWSVLSLHRKPTCVEQNCSNMIKKHFVNSNQNSALVNIATQSLRFRMLQNDQKKLSPLLDFSDVISFWAIRESKLTMFHFHVQVSFQIIKLMKHHSLCSQRGSPSYSETFQFVFGNFYSENGKSCFQKVL